MITKTTNDGKEVGTIFEKGTQIWRGGKSYRWVITEDGFVVLIQEPCYIRLYGDSFDYNFPEDNIDHYIKDHPENVFVWGCKDLVNNIKKFAFTNKKYLSEIPFDLNGHGCDGSSQYISFLGEKYKTHGHFLSSTIECVINHPDIRKVFVEHTLNEKDENDMRLKGCILVADVLMNIARGIMQTDIPSDCIPYPHTQKEIKRKLCEVVIDVFKSKEFKRPRSDKDDFLYNRKPNETYFNWVKWFKDEYYSDNKD